MKPSTELHQLIRSLTKSEKRFFKLQSALQSGPKNYLRLFDAIDRQQEYDEEAIRKRFAGERFIRHLPSEKNYLYKLILKALRAFHADATASGILKQEIKNIEILYQKGLTAECERLLHRAKRIARENERFYYWSELLSWEKMLLEVAYESGRLTKDLDALIEEESGVIEKLRNLAAYQVLYSRINRVFRSGGYVRTEQEHAMVEGISEHPLIKGRNTALSHRAATICYYTQGFCHWAKRDWRSSLEKFLRVRRILDEAPLIKADLPARYVRAQQYIVNAHIELMELEEARAEIARLRALPQEPGFGSLSIGAQVYVAGVLSELRLLDRAGEHALAVEMAPGLIEGMQQLGERLRKESALEFQWAMACVHFGAGQANKALTWLNKVLNDNEQALRQDIFTYARLFNLVVHYELGNHDLLAYIVRSAQRFLGRRQEALEVERVLVDGIKRLARSQDPAQRRAIFKELHGQLEELLKDPAEQLVLKYFDVLAWAEAHASGAAFSDVVKARLRRPAAV